MKLQLIAERALKEIHMKIASNVAITFTYVNWLLRKSVLCIVRLKNIFERAKIALKLQLVAGRNTAEVALSRL